MQSDEFEKAFSDWLDSNPCDAAEGLLFRAMRAAFAAGWEAAKKEQATN